MSYVQVEIRRLVRMVRAGEISYWEAAQRLERYTVTGPVSWIHPTELAVILDNTIPEPRRH